MRVITHTCPICGTIVAANVLENNRVMKCPGFRCQEVLRFEDVDRDAREHFLENLDRYQI